MARNLLGARVTISIGHGTKDIFVARTRDPGTKAISAGVKAASTAAARNGAKDVGPAPPRRKQMT